MFNINIKPKQIFVDDNMPKAEVLRVHIVNLTPNTSAVFSVSLCAAIKDINGNITGAGQSISEQRYTLQGEDYNNWGSEDTPYLEDKILQSVNCERL